MSYTELQLNNRSKQVNSIVFDADSRCSNTMAEFDMDSRAKQYQEAILDMDNACRIFDMETYQSITQPINNSADDKTLFSVYIPPDPDSVEPGSYIDTDTLSLKNYCSLILYEGDLTKGGSLTSTNLTPYLTSFKLSKRKNSLDTWTIVLQDTADRDLSPKNTTSPLSQKLFIDYYAKDYEIKKYLVFTMYHGSTIWKSNDLIGTNYSYNSKNRVLTLSGADRCKHLFLNNQSMDPWKDTTAKKIIEDICEEYEVKHNLTFEDYNVKEFNFANTSPISRINDLLAAGMATWRYKDNVFYAFPDVDKEKSQDWIYIDRHNIYDLTYNQDLNDYYNEVTVGRTNLIDNMCIIEGKEFGFHMENLCVPLLHPKVSASAKMGKIALIYTGNDSGCAQHDDMPVDILPDNCNGGGYGGPATWISFVYKQAEGLTAPGYSNAETGYKIKVVGFNPDLYDKYGNDQNYVFHYKVQEEIDKYGKWTYPSTVDNPLILNTKHAERYAKWLLRQHSRTKEHVSKITPLNFFVDPCHTICVTDYGTGMISERYYLENVDCSFSKSESQNTFNGTKYSGLDGFDYK